MFGTIPSLLSRKAALLLVLLALAFSPRAGAQGLAPSDAILSLMPLMEGTWEVDTVFASGQRFHQRKVFSWGLQGHLVRSATKGIINPQTQEFGLRNEGMVAYRTADSTLRAYEVDILGGVTEAILTVNGRDFHWDYQYQGQRFRDSWFYVSADEYRYEIHAWNEAGTHTLYLQAPIVRRSASLFDREFR